MAAAAVTGQADAGFSAVVEPLARELRRVGEPAGALCLAGPPLVTGRSTVYLVGPPGRPLLVVKVPALGRTPVDTDPALSGEEQFRALVRAHAWLEEEGRHSVARPVALVPGIDAVVMEFVPGTPLRRTLLRCVVRPAAARRAVAAAGDALQRLHRHAAGPGSEVGLLELAEDVRSVEARVLRPVGVRLPPAVQRALAGVPDVRVPARQVLLHGDYAPSNLIVTGADEVGMFDPVLARTGLPEDDLARFTALLSSESVFLPGVAVPPVARLRRDIEDAFRGGYGPGPDGRVLELRLLRAHVLRWRRRRDHSRLAGHPGPARARQAVVDAHMRALVEEAAARLSDRRSG